MAAARSGDLELTVKAMLPDLAEREVTDLARTVARLADAFQPVAIHLFGSHARGTATAASDIDLLVVVPDSTAPGYRRDQQAYATVGDHLLPLDILVWTQAEYEQQLDVPASLPATAAREGRILYAA